jgi:hypothetical protein
VPRKKFNKDHAEKFWSNYTRNLNESISQAEKEGLEKGFSSYQIEVLWQEKTKQRAQKESRSEEEASK